ncbi:uncharacterized protein K02A2.6-like [Dendronephthya gigantea]|uniref:uncharacterized protein K02A2.6-like n=1 Tax=Dendronephthya gigantea TaxID=151771 RepID=UPI00106BFB29|nr:uncharacterized protein K02A2.6-like [Dendronephthya gigantea]
MNGMIDQLIGQCFECQVVTKRHTEEPIKPTVIPKKLWEEIAIDFASPYLDGHYNLVAVDKRTRYPEVKVTPSTSFPPTQVRLKRMFANHSVPECVDSDNGPPFNNLLERKGLPTIASHFSTQGPTGRQKDSCRPSTRQNISPIYKEGTNQKENSHYKTC